MSDVVYIRNAAISATVGLDCWHRDKPQPVLVSCRLNTSVKLAGEGDDVSQTINYGFVYKDLTAALSDAKFQNLEVLAEEVCKVGLKTGGGRFVKAMVNLPKGLLQAAAVGFECSMEIINGKEPEKVPETSVLTVSELKVMTLIGVNKHEREDKQMVIINLRLHGWKQEGASDYQNSLKPFVQHAEDATFLTLEAFVLSLAKLAVEALGYAKVTVSTQKPSAYALMEGPGVEVTRSKDDF